MAEIITRRIRINVKGRVQGVGFRPTVYRYAKGRDLTGWVSNTSAGVIIEVEGDSENLDDFLKNLKSFPPPQAEITLLATSLLPLQNDKQFKILPSITQSQKKTQISPDIASCPECLGELFDPGNRRYLYPFLNCTNCGPRFTITEDLPYDRHRTTMERFTMCPQCLCEYQDPLNRRFHAQPNACSECGPQITLVQSSKFTPLDSEPRKTFGLLRGKHLAGFKVQSSGIKAIKEAIELLGDGRVVAIKGLGGFHLACDAFNEKAVGNLRNRKYREHKPFALMAKDLDTIKRFCEVSSEEEKLLLSWRRPIVLLKKKTQITADRKHRLPQIAEQVAPSNKYLGVMLPYTPLHHLLFNWLSTNTHYLIPAVLVMTSGNISDEPIVYENKDAVFRLSPVADYFLVHNRDILIRCDDSVTRVFLPTQSEMIVRRSRGYAPQPLIVPFSFEEQILACGAHLKNTFCLGKGDQIFVSQHIGDLESWETFRAFKEGIEHFKKLFDIEPVIIAHDMHPEYLSTKYAREYCQLSTVNCQLIPIQHHHAHIVSCLVDNGVDNRRVIGVAFDGTGYGEDGNIWGGEFLVADFKGFRRKAHLKYIPLPGGEQAIREPWRMAATYLYKAYGEKFCESPLDFILRMDKDKWTVLERMIEKRINSPLTSSMGRLFDAVSSLIGLRDKVNYEGQAAMELEMAIEENQKSKIKNQNYGYEINKEKEVFIIDPKEIIIGIVEDLQRAIPVPVISAKFHNTVAEMIVETCIRIRSVFDQNYELNEVALSGGVFQNMFLLNRTFNRLIEEGFKVYFHHRVPTNDGGICLGQAVIANAKLTKVNS